MQVALIDGIASTLGAAARMLPALRAKAEFARIGQYCATDSMLVQGAKRGRCDATATTSYGRPTL